jgi:hypothetical protein
LVLRSSRDGLVLEGFWGPSLAENLPKTEPRASGQAAFRYPAQEEPWMSPSPINLYGLGAMDVTRPCKFIRFGAMDVTKPCKFIGFGARRRCPSCNVPPTVWIGTGRVRTLQKNFGDPTRPGELTCPALLSDLAVPCSLSISPRSSANKKQTTTLSTRLSWVPEGSLAGISWCHEMAL